MENTKKDSYWQQIRGWCIIAVIFIHCKAGTDFPLSSFNGLSYFILRNLSNFPVSLFFFISGYFMKPVTDMVEFYKRRLPKLVFPYLFYSCVYFAISLLSGSSISVKQIIGVIFFGTASTPLYYIVVLTYFTLLAPFLQKAIYNKFKSTLIILSTPFFLCSAYVLLMFGTDIWSYLKYSPVWLSFYYLGMVIREKKPVFSKTKLWILLIIAFGTELIETVLLMKIDDFNAYTQIRLFGMFYAAAIVLLVYEYSKNTDRNRKFKILTSIGNDSYAIYYIHCAVLIVFSKLFPFGRNTILPLYVLCELLFSIFICELVIFLIKKIIRNDKLRVLFGV